MNIYEELLAGKTIDENKVNVRPFVVKSRLRNGNVDFTLFHHDPAYAIPTLKIFGNDEAKTKARLLVRAPGYSKFISYICKLNVGFDNQYGLKHSYDASSLEELKQKVDLATKHALDVSKLELFDLDDPDAVSKACA